MWAAGSWHMLFSYVTTDPSLPDGVHWNIATATSQRPGPLVGGLPVAGTGRNARRGITGHRARTERALRGHLPVRPGRFLAPGDRGPPLLPDLDGPGALVAAEPAGPIPGPVAGRPDDRRRLCLHRPSAPVGFQVLVTHPARRVRDRPLDHRPPAGSVDAGRSARHRCRRRHHRELRVRDGGRSVAARGHVEQSRPAVAVHPDREPGDRDRMAAVGERLGTRRPRRAVQHRSRESRVIGYEHANSAFLCVASRQPGHFSYLLYAGSDELTQFGGWGHAKIGVARSTDLVHWQVPPS